MGLNAYTDIPGNYNGMTLAAASVASNGADTLYQPIGRVPNRGYVQSIHIIPSASQNAATDNYRTWAVINLGSAGSGTTVVGSLALTATKAANVAQALTLTTGSGLAAGDVLAYYTTSTGNGIAVNAAQVHVIYCGT